MAKKENRYKALVEKIFFDRYSKGARAIDFERPDIEAAAADLSMKPPKNLGDMLYSFRFRTALPDRILSTQPEGMEWLIAMAGKGKYRFLLFSQSRIVPNPALATIAVPDATPEIIRSYALDDEQALLAIVRYNRLLDIFLGLTTYSLQNHLRTTVADIGQIEIDELYVGIDKYGCHYVVPVQAKGGKDQISVVQTIQDLAWCADRFPDMRAKAISVQFLGQNRIAFFELVIQDYAMRVAEERHYQLVPGDQINSQAIRNYRD
ncbi:MAG: endonuclease [Phyllobacteriaceae bacterium]|nr:endonuclease [Phyllobacteriaceae bacterium]